MIFITLSRFREKPTKETIAEIQKLFERSTKEGGKVLGFYWTLGRYDVVTIYEASDEKAAMQGSIAFGEFSTNETMVAVPAEEAMKLVG